MTVLVVIGNWCSETPSQGDSRDDPPRGSKPGKPGRTGVDPTRSPTTAQPSDGARGPHTGLGPKSVTADVAPEGGTKTLPETGGRSEAAPEGGPEAEAEVEAKRGPEAEAESESEREREASLECGPEVKNEAESVRGPEGDGGFHTTLNIGRPWPRPRGRGLEHSP